MESRNPVSGPVPHRSHGLWGFLLVLAPGSAEAHVTGVAGGFVGGFAHPLTGPDHFLAMFAVGLWGAQMGGRSVWMLPMAFPLIMTLGGVAGMAGLPMNAVETGIAVSVLVLGLAIAMVWRPPEPIPLVLIGVFAIFHGYAHGVELPAAADPAAYSVGFVVATGLIHLLGIAIGLWLHTPLHGWLTRGLGALIAGGGVYFLVA